MLVYVRLIMQRLQLINFRPLDIRANIFAG